MNVVAEGVETMDQLSQLAMPGTRPFGVNEQRTALRQAELINEWARLKSPIAFERVRSRADFAAAEIEDAVAPFTRSAHHFPIHEVIGGKLPRRGYAASVKRQNLVAKVEIQHRSNCFAAA